MLIGRAPIRPPGPVHAPPLHPAAAIRAAPPGARALARLPIDAPPPAVIVTTNIVPWGWRASCPRDPMDLPSPPNLSDGLLL